MLVHTTAAVGWIYLLPVELRIFRSALEDVMMRTWMTLHCQGNCLLAASPCPHVAVG
jgi:hypothetical protein